MAKLASFSEDVTFQEIFTEKTIADVVFCLVGHWPGTRPGPLML